MSPKLTDERVKKKWQEEFKILGHIPYLKLCYFSFFKYDNFSSDLTRIQKTFQPERQAHKPPQRV